MITGRDSVFLFQDSPLLFVPETALIVYFPAEAKLTEAQKNLLNQLVSALKIRKEKVQWIFYSGHQADKKAVIERISPAGLVMLFRAEGDAMEEPIVHSEAGVFLIELPDLQKIEQSLELKKKVWAAMKPHAGA